MSSVWCCQVFVRILLREKHFEKYDKATAQIRGKELIENRAQLQGSGCDVQNPVMKA